jgi:hypothetical protein
VKRMDKIIKEIKFSKEDRKMKLRKNRNTLIFQILFTGAL